MQRRISEVDVFTRDRYRGNPCAVVVDGEGLADEDMQRFAHWMNLSETTFLLPPEDAGADYRVRIFTPVAELPFAGHPTLASCHAWLEADGAPADQAIVQECAAGLVQIRRDDDRLSFAAPPLIRSGPVDDALIAELAEVLGIETAAIVDAQWADNGPGWVAVLLADAESVLALKPRFSEHDIGVAGPHPPGGDADWEVRAFFPKDGATVEDPVTGSLNASLAEWLIRSGRASAPYVAAQGTALGRNGRAFISTDDDGTIWVGGGTVTCISGTVEL
jgi:PhzF family phenazine biosynthesis protein